jgi:hypothetical protein
MSLFIPVAWFEGWVLPLLLLINIISGVILVYKNKNVFRVLMTLLILSTSLVLLEIISPSINTNLKYIKLIAYFAFYAIVTIEIINQIWKTKVVSKNVILGLMAGYISLGLLAFFLCLSIEVMHPNSFSGLVYDISANADLLDQLMYFSYITLMSIGYGDILPITATAQKATVFIGLIGQFYLVVLTAIVVGKYINQDTSS